MGDEQITYNWNLFWLWLLFLLKLVIQLNASHFLNAEERFDDTNKDLFNASYEWKKRISAGAQPGNLRLLKRSEANSQWLHGSTPPLIPFSPLLHHQALHFEVNDRMYIMCSNNLSR